MRSFPYFRFTYYVTHAKKINQAAVFSKNKQAIQAEIVNKKSDLCCDAGRSNLQQC
jgi:hypothetical protein